MAAAIPSARAKQMLLFEKIEFIPENSSVAIGVNLMNFSGLG
jgi:hypothetical protein